jgi:hypothetical protein
MPNWTASCTLRCPSSSELMVQKAIDRRQLLDGGILNRDCCASSTSRGSGIERGKLDLFQCHLE